MILKLPDNQGSRKLETEVKQLHDEVAALTAAIEAAIEQAIKNGHKSRVVGWVDDF